MLGGAVALATAGLIAKLLSAVYRVLVARWLGAEAVGLYELAAPVLSTGMSLCGMGLPVASAALVAGALGRGDLAGSRRLLRASRLFLLATGGLGAVLVFATAPQLAAALGNPAASGPIRAIAPAILIASLLSGEKAWLQGSGRIAPSAAVVTSEQLARVGAALTAAAAFRGRASGAGTAAEAATLVAWAPSVGAAGGMLACALADSRTTVAVAPAQAAAPRRSEPAWRALARAGFPNWVAGAISSLTTALDAGFVIWRLRGLGLGDFAATAWLGELNGMALPLAMGPSVLFGAVGSALIPDLAHHWARGEREAVRHRAGAAYFWTLAVAAPCALVLCQLAAPICRLLFPRNAGAALPLGVLAFSGLALAAGYVAAAVANAVGRPGILLPGATIGAALKSALVLLFTGIRGLGIQGAACGILLGQAVGAGLNVRAVARAAGCRPPWTSLLLVAGPGLLGQAAAVPLAWHAAAAAPLPSRVVLAGLAAAAGYLLGFAAAWRALHQRLDLGLRPRA